MKTFALIGAAGYVAPRHMRAIQHVDGDLVAALDPHDSVGILDSYFPDCRFFTSPERFDRWLNKWSGKIDYVVICSPNWLHDAHCRWALRSGADAICEKPIVLNPWNIDQLEQIQNQTHHRVHPVLQLRIHPAVLALRSRMETALMDHHVDATLTYVTRRGRWYDVSWKGNHERSGGVLMNLGIHFFDLACLLFGTPRSWSCTHEHGAFELGERAEGRIDFDRASMKWLLSTRAEDLPDAVQERGGHAHRSLCVDHEIVDFSSGFEDLHNNVYENVLAGVGPRLIDARPAVDLVHRLREGS